jgi:hypothetical protein
MVASAIRIALWTAKERLAASGGPTGRAPGSCEISLYFRAEILTGYVTYWLRKPECRWVQGPPDGRLWVESTWESGRTVGHPALMVAVGAPSSAPIESGEAAREGDRKADDHRVRPVSALRRGNY